MHPAARLHYLVCLQYADEGCGEGGSNLPIAAEARAGRRLCDEPVRIYAIHGEQRPE
ncbi:hypothetical protein D3C78_1741870 [compost metagenome]